MGILERRMQEKEQRREDIISAASHVFCTKGLESATMEDIAKHAELSKATLYLYFKNKEELFLAVLLIVVDEFCNIIEASQKAENTCTENLHAMGRAYVDFYLKFPDYLKMLNRLEPVDEVVFEKYEISYDLASGNNRIWEIVCKPIIEGIEVGVFKPDTNPIEIALSLWMSSIGTINLMERVSQSPHHNLAVQERPDCQVLLELKNLDFIKMMENMWNAIINHIMV